MTLPLQIGGLLLLGVLIGAFVVYGSVRDAAMRQSVQRLGDVTKELRGLLDANGVQYRKIVRAIADTAPVVAFVRTQDGAHHDAVTKALELSPDAAAVTALREIRSAADSLLMRVGNGPNSADPAIDAALVRDAVTNNAEVIGPIHVVGDSVFYAAAAPIRIHGKARAVYIEWRRITSTPQAREQLNALIGTGAKLLLGSTQGGGWTDLVHAVAGPPVAMDTATGAIHYDRPGVGSVVAMARPVPGTPWTVLVEFSRAEALAPATRFLGRLGIITAIMLVVLLAGTWLASRTLMRPLADLTHAAEAVAHGQFDGAVSVGERQDEIGRLATAFTTMVAHVRESQEELEHRVAERTRELKERNEELEAFGYSLAHDLRAPLRAMQGFSQALLEDHSAQLDPTGRHYAELVSEGAQTMDRMILDLLNYSRVARTDLDNGPVDLGQTVTAATRQVKGDLAARRAHLTVDPALPTAVGHPATLVQVFANLIGNAVKFVPADRIPEVRVRAIQRNGT
ncbi:MAG: sensor histidine kinase, partial [Gemmatimonadales bacterium]